MMKVMKLGTWTCYFFDCTLNVLLKNEMKKPNKVVDKKILRE